jgi:hypothetical protein
MAAHGEDDNRNLLDDQEPTTSHASTINGRRRTAEGDRERAVHDLQQVCMLKTGVGVRICTV